MSKKQVISPTRKFLTEYAGGKKLHSFNETHYYRAVNIILEQDENKLKSLIIQMYDSVDFVDAKTEKSDKIIHILEWLLYLTVKYKDEMSQTELVYNISRQIVRNLKIIAENPNYILEEELLGETILRYSKKLGELKRLQKSPREISEDISEDKTDFDFYYIG